MDHQLAARAGDRIGRIQVRVAGQLPLAVEQQIARPGVAAIPQVQHDVLGERPDAILLGGSVNERQHSRGL